MNPIKNLLILSILPNLILLVGCNMPAGGSTLPQDPGPAYTQAAETIIAALTQAAPTSMATLPAPVDQAATDTPLPPAPDTPTLTPTATETPLPTATPTATTTEQTAKVLFEDNFEGNTSWYTVENNRFSLRYEDDGYAIRVDLVNAPVWSVRLQDWADVRLEVDAAHLDGPEDGYFGLTCRHADDANYYAFLINSQGGYGIGRVIDNDFEFLDEGSDSTGILKTGDATNHLRADCIGETLRLYVNGQKLLEVDADDFDSGDIGLIVKTGARPGLDVFFDNFAVLEPNS